MQTGIETGLFGKLPAHGDFVQRNLSTGFINIWDEWLQHFIAGTREQLVDDWLEIYLTSPIWRFIFSPGVIDESIWTGVMIPSVDRVGRYYPFSIVRKLPADINPFEYINLYKNWYEEIERLSLDALDDQIVIDKLVDEIAKAGLVYHSDYLKAGFHQEQDGIQLDMEFEEQAASTVYAALLDSVMTKSFQSYSLWQTTGSEFINPCLCMTQGLPDVKKMAAMLNGEWKNSGWTQPYTLNEIDNRETA